VDYEWDGLETDTVSALPVALAGDLTSSQPIAEVPTEQIEGFRCRSFLDDYYNRVHVYSDIDFGYFATEQETAYTVWNAYLYVGVTGTYTSDDENNISIVDSSGTPYSSTDTLYLGALQYMPFTVTAPIEGDATFDITHTWTFDYEAPTLTITGIRVVILPFRPEGKLRETLAWLTQVLRANDGSEQRITLRRIPRRRFDFEIGLGTAALGAQYERLMDSQAHRHFGVPVWQELRTLTGQTLTAGDTTLAVDTSYASYRAGGLAVVWQSETVCEIVDVASVAAGSIALDGGGLANSYSGTVIVMPAEIGYLSGPAQNRRDLCDNSRITLGLHLRFNAAVTGYTADRLYHDRPVLERIYAPEGWVAETIDPMSNIVDYQTGQVEVIGDAEHRQTSRTYRLWRDSRADAWDLRQLLHSLYGRQRTCWVPSYRADMVQYAAATALNTTIPITSVGVPAAYSGSTIRNHVAVWKTNGTHHYRQVTGLTAGSPSDSLTLDRALGEAINPGDVTISWLDRCRLGSDSVTLIWHSAARVQSDIPLVRIKA